MRAPSPVVCKHGQLARACNVCELEAELAAARAWRDTVDDMLVVCHEVASDDPRESVNRLINWHVSVQMDPAVSSAAQALIDQGAAAERERWTTHLSAARSS